MKVLGQFLIGAVILGLATLCSQWFALILVCSIILSAGLALIIWIPLAYAIGYVAWAVLSPGSYIDSTPPSEDEPEFRENRTWRQDGRAVTEFIRKARVQGVSDNQIELHLLDQGWSPIYIRNALRDKK